jgi:hypothetical protein
MFGTGNATQGQPFLLQPMKITHTNPMQRLGGLTFKASPRKS